MFDEMKEADSKIPEMVDYLSIRGWQIKDHHDNWILRDYYEEGYPLNIAYELAKQMEVHTSEGVTLDQNYLKACLLELMKKHLILSIENKAYTDGTYEVVAKIYFDNQLITEDATSFHTKTN